VGTGISLSPDLQKVYFTQVDAEESDLMLVRIPLALPGGRDPGGDSSPPLNGADAMQGDRHKVNAGHLKRSAYLYIRQSRPRQVLKTPSVLSASTLSGSAPSHLAGMLITSCLSTTTWDAPPHCGAPGA
jgi:hypothetical protein